MTLPEMIKMTIKPSPFSIRAAGSAIVLALGLTAAPAGAADLTLDLPEQALSRSLNTIAQQGQIQLVTLRCRTTRCTAGTGSARQLFRTDRHPDTAGRLRPDTGTAGQQLCYPPADNRSGNHFNPGNPGSGRAGLPSGHGCHVCPAIHYCGGDPPAQYR